MPQHDAPPLRLIPTPRETTRRAGEFRITQGVRYSGPDEPLARRILDPALSAAGIPWTTSEAATTIVVQPPHAAVPPENDAYRLATSPDPVAPILLHAASTAALRHALVTLAQLIARFGRSLPSLDIRDAPAIPLRGVMLDISRDKVPTMASLRAFIDQMEMLKLNHLQLYTEHTFAYASHEQVWRDASPITPAEIRELDAYARERGVELAANQNCLGHLHRWLKLPRYAPLAEIPPDITHWTFETDDGRAITKTGPHSLCPTDPRSLVLIEDLLSQLLPNFSSPLVNIGCDEAFDLGQGRSRDEVNRRSRAAVYFDWLRAVDTIVKRHHKHTLFWADIALRHPDSLHLIPDHASPLMWGYEATSFLSPSPPLPFSRSSPSSPARQQGAPWFCPGTSSWLSITGRTRNRHANLASAARLAAEARLGFLCCDWGDRGHRQHWPISLHAIAHAAHEAWTGGDSARPFDPVASALHCFGDSEGVLGVWLEAVGDLDADLSARASLRNTNSLFTELHRPLREPPSDPSRHGSHDDWQSIRERLDGLRARLATISPSIPDLLVRDELEHTLRLAEHAADKAIVTRACLNEPERIPRGSARIRLAADLAAIAEDHRALWPRRNRPGGLDDSVAHYEKIIQDYEHPCHFPDP